MPTPAHPRIKVESPFHITELTSFEATQRENEHAIASFTAVLDAQDGYAALDQRLEGALVRFIDSVGGAPIFTGLIQSAEVSEQAGLFTLRATALSGSILLDQVRRCRSYQDATLLHEDVIRLALADASPDADFIMRTDDMPIGAPLVQYAETAWEFAIRLASHFNTTVTPDMDSGIPRFWLGLRVPSGGDCDFSGCDYKAAFDGKFFDTGGAHLGFSRAQFLSYVVRSADNFPLGASAHFMGRDLFICRKACISGADGVPVYSYTLGTAGLLARQKHYNDKLTGLSLLGTVIATQGGTVKLHLDIDKSQDMDTAHCFRWAPPTGNLMYLMPKLGSQVSLYFPDPGEDSAKAVNCVRSGASVETPGFIDTEERGLSTEHGKRLRLFPGSFGLDSDGGGGPLHIMATDGEGVALETQHGITIAGDGAVSFEAPVIELASPSQTGIYYSGGQDIDGGFVPQTSMTLIQDGTLVDSEAGQSIISGDIIGPYDYYKDAPEEGQFDWGGLFKNVLAAVAVVAAVVVYAAACTASFGLAGPILLAGGMAIAGMVAKDIARGNVSSTGDYMREALISSVVGLATGGLGSAFQGLKAASTVGKIGLMFGKGAIQGAVGSATSQIMRAGAYGEDIDWGAFFRDVGIGTVAGGVSSLMAGGLGGGLNSLAKGIFGERSPAMNVLLTSAISGITGGGANLGMQLLNMAVFDGGIDWGNVDWRSIAVSGTIGAIQGFTEAREQNRIRREFEELEKLIAGTVPDVAAADGSDQPTAVEGNDEARVEVYRVGRPVEPTEKTLQMALDKETYVREIVNKYGINLRGSGKEITIEYNDELVHAYGKVAKDRPTVITLGQHAFSSEIELANTIAHELNHCRSFLNGGTAPEWDIGQTRGGYSAGNAITAYINGER